MLILVPTDSLLLLVSFCVLFWLVWFAWLLQFVACCLPLVCFRLQFGLACVVLFLFALLWRFDVLVYMLRFVIIVVTVCLVVSSWLDIYLVLLRCLVCFFCLWLLVFVVAI